MEYAPQVLFQIFLDLPWQIHAFLALGLAAGIIGINALFGMKKNIQVQWYERWERHINNSVREVRRKYPRKERKFHYEYMFSKLWVELKAELGDNYCQLTTGQRGIWIMLATRHRDVMYFHH
jgi:hypothetical protein